MKYIFITNQPDLASYAYNNGADRIMVDLEINGKVERQKFRNTLISMHRFDDIKSIKDFNKEIKIITRINPYHIDTEKEIDLSILYGTDYIMLPMFKSKLEVENVYNYINGRAKLILLFETPESIIRINEITTQKKFDEAHIGLNDLSIAMGIEFMFELLISGFIDYVVDYFKSNEIPFGIGGIAKFGEGIANSELVISEHVRLGSTSVILSRSFHEYSSTLNELVKRVDFKKEIDLLNQCENKFLKSNNLILERNKLELRNQINNYLNHGYKG